MKKPFYLLFLLVGINGFFLNAQNVVIEGYAFEEGNRGFINQVTVNVFDQNTNDYITQVSSNPEGFFSIALPAGRIYRLESSKDLFEKVTQEVDARNAASGEKLYIKLEMTREPGYIFEVTLAPKRESEDIVVPAIKGALIEVYNNTKQEEVMVLEDHPHPDFKVQFKKGNHYTVLVRKKGFLTKRMEAFVNVEGCILCFEGVGEVRPGVTDNLSNGLEMGTLLANVELVPVYIDKIIELQNITYDFGESKLTSLGKEELSKLASIMEDNPHMKVELGSHTDVRGKGSANRTLSERRAQSAVDFLTKERKIRKDRIIAHGYGESQIKNKCKSGVECTEEEHAVNRRTEIKILEIDQNQPQKSLLTMKKEEEFERMILGEGVEQIKSPSKEEKASESMDSGGIDEDHPAMEIEEHEEDADHAAMEAMKKADLQKKAAEEKAMQEMKLLEAEERQKKLDEEADERTKSEQEQRESLEMKNMSDSDVQVKQEKTLTMEADDPNVIKRQKDAVFEEKRKQSAANVEAFESEDRTESTGIDDYTGSKIVIHFSRFPLSAEHEIYEKFEDVIAFETPQKNILYMIGDHETKEQAEKYRLVYLEKDFPNAYVVEFINGKRIN